MRHIAIALVLTSSFLLFTTPSHANHEALKARLEAWVKAVGRDFTAVMHFVEAADRRLPVGPHTAEAVVQYRAGAERVARLCATDFADLVATPPPSDFRYLEGRDAWRMCAALKRREELLPVMAEGNIRNQADRIAKNQIELADRLPANKGWITGTGPAFTLKWGGGRGNAEWIQKLRDMSAAAGLPDTLVDEALSEASGGYWAKVEALGRTTAPSDATAHDKALEARAGKHATALDPTLKVVQAGMHSADWDLTLDAQRRQPISRTRSGFLVVAREGEPLCREVVFVVGEHYQGKRWSGGGGEVAFERFRFVACP